MCSVALYNIILVTCLHVQHSVSFNGCGHMYGSARGRQILQYKINPNPNPNTNPSSPYCIMRFIFGSRVHVPSRVLTGAILIIATIHEAGVSMSTWALSLTHSQSSYNSYEQDQIYQRAFSGRLLDKLHLLLIRKLHTVSFQAQHAALPLASLMR